MTQRGERPLPNADGRFRIVSANLWNGAAEPRAFAELLAEVGADAVATQEMTPEQADAIAQVLPHGLLEPARDFTGMGIALREPCRVHRLALPCRDARVAEVRCENAAGGRLELELVNVHMQAPHWMTSWRSFGHRSGQLRGLLRHLEASPKRRRVVVGDFNATPIWPLYRRLVAHLNDAAVLAARRHGRTVQRTWGPWAGAPRLLRIDHALVHGVGIDDFQVLPVAGGDHSAIVVDVALPIAMLSADAARGADATRDHASTAPAALTAQR